MNLKLRTILFALLLGTMVLSAACVQADPSIWETIEEQVEDQEATVDEAVAGGEFNRFFPESNGDGEVVFIQEKSGFAEAVLKQDGEDVATLAVFDTVSNPDAAAKYADSDETVGGYPAVDVGTNGLAVLVADRFQVQVRALNDDFTRNDRETWLEAFDLDGLAALDQ